jgi:hypothetical protein
VTAKSTAAAEPTGTSGRAAAAPAVAPKSPAGKTAAEETAASAKGADSKSTSASAGAAAPAAEAGAKKLFIDNAARAGLRYAVVQQTAAGDVEVDPDTTFHSGDKVRFTFEPNIDGFLYLVQEGSSGKWTMLFPNPQINGGVNAVQRGQKYAIPTQGWFVFDKTAGTERAFVFLTKEPLSQLPGFKQPVTRVETIDRPLVDQMRNAVKSRDLVFERERPAESGASGQKRQAVFVVNRDELGQSVSATIQLAHKE